METPTELAPRDPDFKSGARRWTTSAIRGGLIAAVLAIYLQALGHGFAILDDSHVVTDNPSVMSGLTAEGLTWAFTTGHFSNYMPLTWLTHMLDIELYGVNAGGHHFTNLLLHLAAVLLLFDAMRALTGTLWPSAAVAALFAVHPLHVESVVWIAERKGLLANLFWMLTLRLYAAYVPHPHWGRYAAITVSFVLGLLCKQMLVTLPAAMLLLDYWPLARWRTWTELRPLILEKLPLFLLAMAFSVVAYVAQNSGGAVSTFDDIPLSIRFPNAILNYVRGLRMAFWPVGLCPYYPLRFEGYPVAPSLAAAIFLLVLTALAIAWRRRGYLPVGWLWYLGTMLPVVGLVQVGLHSMADRYTDIPLIGIYIAVVWSLRDLAARWKGPTYVVAAAGGIVLLALGARAWQQASYWSDSGRLYKHTLAVTTENAMAHNQLGVWLLNQDRFQEALEQFLEVVRINPSLPMSHTNLGLTFTKLGNPQEAIQAYRNAVRLEPQNATAHRNLGISLAQQRQYDEAAEYLTKAVSLKPNDPQSQMNLGIVLMALGQPAAAQAHLEQAVLFDPTSPLAHSNLGVLYQKQGRLAEAVAQFRKAAELEPTNADHLGSLSDALYLSGNLQEAVASYREALALRPGSPVLQGKLAWILATAKDPSLRSGPEAVTLAEQACKATNFQHPRLLDSLAAAYARAGRFEEAAATAQQAIERAKATNQMELATAIAKRSDLYRAGQAYDGQ